MEELARHPGRFGLIRVLKRRSDGARLYCIDDSVQTMTDASGCSLFGYVHALKLLLTKHKKILLLGGAGGSLATMLARRGRTVTVVEIEPAAKTLAQLYFNLHPSVRWISTDAIAYLRRCRERFDAVVVDACDAQQTASPFLTTDWIAQAMRHLRRGGSLLVNLAGAEGPPKLGWDLASTLAAAGWHCSLMRAEDGFEGNELLQVSGCAADALHLSDLQIRPPETRTYLMSLRAYVAAGHVDQSSKAMRALAGPQSP